MWVGRHSVINIAPCNELDDPGIESRRGRDFPHTSRPDLGPTNPPAQDVPSVFPGVKVARPWRRGKRKSRAITQLPFRVIMACYTVTFTFTCEYKRHWHTLTALNKGWRKACMRVASGPTVLDFRKMKSVIRIKKRMVYLMFCWPCVVIYPYNKNQLDALFISNLFQ
jgi:hypothetical protein